MDLHFCTDRVIPLWQRLEIQCPIKSYYIQVISIEMFTYHCNIWVSIYKITYSSQFIFKVVQPYILYRGVFLGCWWVLSWKLQGNPRHSLHSDTLSWQWAPSCYFFLSHLHLIILPNFCLVSHVGQVMSLVRINVYFGMVISLKLDILITTIMNSCLSLKVGIIEVLWHLRICDLFFIYYMK